MTEKILKRITFTYTIKGEKVNTDSTFSGYYNNMNVSDERFKNFYYTLNDEQKMVFLKLWN